MNLCCDLQSLDVCEYDAGEGLGRQRCLGDLLRYEESLRMISSSYEKLESLLSSLLEMKGSDPEFIATKIEIETEANFLSQSILGLSVYSTELPALGIIQESRVGYLLRLAIKSQRLVNDAETVTSFADEI